MTVYRLRRYRIHRGRDAPFAAFFQERLLPVQERHGARLIGRWRVPAGDAVTALWAYDDHDALERVQAAVAADPDAVAAQAYRRESLEPLIETTDELILTDPRMGADAFLLDGAGRVLLCQLPSGSWCLPGGWLESEESPQEAAERELREETGLVASARTVLAVHVEPEPQTSLHFTIACELAGGALAADGDEVRDARWLDPRSVDRWRDDHERWVAEALAASGSPSSDHADA